MQPPPARESNQHPIANGKLFVGLALVAAAIGSLPLWSRLGRNLEYEATLIITVATVICMPLCLISARLRQCYHLVWQDPTTRRRLLGWQICGGPLLLALPGLLYHQLDYCPCSQESFWLWFAINVYPTWILLQAWLLLLCCVKTLRQSFLKLYGCHILLWVLSFVILASTMWFEPQKRLTSLVWGFLHGPIYDDYLPIDHGVTLKRTAHLILGLWVICLPFISKRWRSLAIIVASITTGLVWLPANRFPSQWHGNKHLQELLPLQQTGDGYTLFHNNKDPKAIAKLSAAIRFHIAEIKEILAPGPFPDIAIYAYPDSRTKKLWFGGGGTDVADVYTPSIHITGTALPHPTLRHELVHALASEIAFHGLGFHPNMAFTEGLAIAIAPRKRNLSLDQAARELLNSKRLPEPEKLFSPRFWEISGPRAYTAAGSIIHYLIQNYGQATINKLYSGSSFADTLGTNTSTLIGNWQSYLAAQADDETFALEAEALYRHPGLMGAVCPHTKALYQDGQRGDPYDRWRLPRWLNSARDYERWLLTLDPSDKRPQIRLWQRQIKTLLKSGGDYQGRLNSWIAMIEDLRQWPPQTLEDITLNLLLGDIKRLTTNRYEALGHLKQIQDLAATKSIGASNLRLVFAKLEIEAIFANEPDKAQEWRKFLAGFSTQMPATPDLDHQPWLLKYLHLRNQPKQITDTSLQNYLTIRPPNHLPQTFAVEWYQLLATNLKNRGYDQSAAQGLKELANLSQPGAKAYWQLEARRLAFESQP